MLEHFDQYGYVGVFCALLAAGFGFPIPEELPVITAGIMVGFSLWISFNASWSWKRGIRMILAPLAMPRFMTAVIANT